MKDFVIDKFRDGNYFLSNFYPAPVTYNEMTFPNNEAAFQAMKCPERAFEFRTLNPVDAKRLGRKVSLRPDWEDVKEKIMYEICFNKFSGNEILRKKLINTGDALLIEGNTWGDREWGVCNGFGKNKLGKILMKIRTELKN